jgi:hypothetical protein
MKQVSTGETGALIRVVVARADARAAERARIVAILKSPEAAGQGALAQALAFDTSMEPEVAIGWLRRVNQLYNGGSEQ